MTDIGELVKRLRRLAPLIVGDMVDEAADALEAQVKRIATLEEFRNEYRRAIIQFKNEYCICITELEKQNEKLRDLAYIAYQDGYKDAPPYSKHERSLDEIEIMWKRSFAYAALKGEK